MTHENDISAGVMDNGKPAVTSAKKLFGFNTIYMVNESGSRYMTRAWLGRLRFHYFWRGDEDPDPHDHPWDFWTFPFRSYVEEVTTRAPGNGLDDPLEYVTHTQVVRAWRLHFRTATHTHRVLGAWTGWHRHQEFGYRVFNDPKLAGPGWVPVTSKRHIPTIVWRSRGERRWGFLKNRKGEWCWVPWQNYIFGGGKDAPCG